MLHLVRSSEILDGPLTVELTASPLTLLSTVASSALISSTAKWNSESILQEIVFTTKIANANEKESTSNDHSDNSNSGLSTAFTTFPSGYTSTSVSSSTTSTTFSNIPVRILLHRVTGDSHPRLFVYNYGSQTIHVNHRPIRQLGLVRAAERTQLRRCELREEGYHFRILDPILEHSQQVDMNPSQALGIEQSLEEDGEIEVFGLVYKYKYKSTSKSTTCSSENENTVNTGASTTGIAKIDDTIDGDPRKHNKRSRDPIRISEKKQEQELEPNRKQQFDQHHHVLPNSVEAPSSFNPSSPSSASFSPSTSNSSSQSLSQSFSQFSSQSLFLSSLPSTLLGLICGYFDSASTILQLCRCCKRFHDDVSVSKHFTSLAWRSASVSLRLETRLYEWVLKGLHGMASMKDMTGMNFVELAKEQGQGHQENEANGTIQIKKQSKSMSKLTADRFIPVALWNEINPVLRWCMQRWMVVGTYVNYDYYYLYWSKGVGNYDSAEDDAVVGSFEEKKKQKKEAGKYAYDIEAADADDYDAQATPFHSDCPFDWISASQLADTDSNWQPRIRSIETMDGHHVEIIEDLTESHLLRLSPIDVDAPRPGFPELQTRFVLRAIPHLQHLEITLNSLRVDAPTFADSFVLVPELVSLTIEQDDGEIEYQKDDLWYFDFDVILSSLPSLTSLRCVNLCLRMRDVVAMVRHPRLEKIYHSHSAAFWAIDDSWLADISRAHYNSMNEDECAPAEVVGEGEDEEDESNEDTKENEVEEREAEVDSEVEAAEVDEEEDADDVDDSNNEYIHKLRLQLNADMRLIETALQQPSTLRSLQVRHNMAASYVWILTDAVLLLDSEDCFRRRGFIKQFKALERGLQKLLDSFSEN